MSRRKPLRRILFISIATLVAALLLSLLHPRVWYVVVAASYQVEVLVGRVPLERALADGLIEANHREKARMVPAIKAHAKSLGLADTGHYSTINPTWNRTVWNVSACEELSFTPQTWWFPIVGTVPYLGYFDEEEARSAAALYQADGLDTHVRTAGAWSTLGWFEDPLLPKMLEWDEARLSNTLFHELTHATVWIPGSVAFNESFANFVGEEAALDYLSQKYGEESPQVRGELARRADRQVYLHMMRSVYHELDDIYRDESLTPAVKRSRKAQILDGIPQRAMTEGFSAPEKWSQWFAQKPWNNAVLVQFRVYNQSPEWFAAIRNDTGDLAAFIQRIRKITAGAPDPFAAVQAAAEKLPAQDEPQP